MTVHLLSKPDSDSRWLAAVQKPVSPSNGDRHGCSQVVKTRPRRYCQCLTWTVTVSLTRSLSATSDSLLQVSSQADSEKFQVPFKFSVILPVIAARHCDSEVGPRLWPGPLAGGLHIQWLWSRGHGNQARATSYCSSQTLWRASLEVLTGLLHCHSGPSFTESPRRPHRAGFLCRYRTFATKTDVDTFGTPARRRAPWQAGSRVMPSFSFYRFVQAASWSRWHVIFAPFPRPGL